MITFSDKIGGVLITDTERQDKAFISRESFEIRQNDKLTTPRIEISGHLDNNKSFYKACELSDFDPALALADIDAAFDYLAERKQPKISNLTFAGASQIDNLASKTVWPYVGTEPHPYRATSGVTMSISSDNGADIGQQVTVVLGVDGTGVSKTETVTLNGTTKVSFSGSWLAIDLVQIVGAPTAGNVYIYKDGAITAGVPNTTSDVVQYIPAGDALSTGGTLTVPTDRKYLIDWLSFGTESSTALTFRLEMNITGQPTAWFNYLEKTISFDGMLDGFAGSPIVLDPGRQYRLTAKSKSGTGIVCAAVVGIRTLVV